MAIVFSRSAVAAAAAAILQVFKADLMGSVAAALEAALNIWGVSIEQHRAHSHCPGQLVCQGALAVSLACEQVVGLFAHHFSCLSRSPNIHRLCRQSDVVKAWSCQCVNKESELPFTIYSS